MVQVGNYRRICENFSNMFGGGGGGNSAPDYTPVANASTEAAQISKQLGEDQLAENKRQYDLNMATAKPIIDAQTKLMGQAYDQGNQNYQDLQTKGKPIQDQMASIAMGGDYTDAQKAKQQEAADLAVADARAGSTSSMNQLVRQGLRYGYSPARLAALSGSAAMGNAQQQVQAANGARVQKQQQQQQQMGDVYNTYAGMASQAPALYNSGTQAGSAAAGTSLNTSNAYMGNMNAANNTIMQGQGLKVQGLGSTLNAQTNAYGLGLQSSAASAAGLGSLLGTGIAKWG